GSPSAPGNVTGSSTITSVGLKPLSSAAAYTNGLNEEPGWRNACVARLKLLSFQSRPPVSARTSPLRGSIATTAPWRYGGRVPGGILPAATSAVNEAFVFLSAISF